MYHFITIHIYSDILIHVYNMGVTHLKKSAKPRLSCLLFQRVSSEHYFITVTKAVFANMPPCSISVLRLIWTESSQCSEIDGKWTYFFFSNAVFRLFFSPSSLPSSPCPAFLHTAGIEPCAGYFGLLLCMLKWFCHHWFLKAHISPSDISNQQSSANGLFFHVFTPGHYTLLLHTEQTSVTVSSLDMFLALLLLAIDYQIYYFYF